MIFRVTDSNGWEWCWNPKTGHLYIELTESELDDSGMTFDENGYHNMWTPEDVESFLEENYGI